MDQDEISGSRSSNSTKECHHDLSKANSHRSDVDIPEIVLSDSTDEPMIVEEIKSKAIKREGIVTKKSKKKRDRDTKLKQDVAINSSQATLGGNKKKLDVKPTGESQCRHKSINRDSQSSNLTNGAEVTNETNKNGDITNQTKSAARSYDFGKAQDIVAYVLDKSEFKTPNLSQLLMEKFSDPDYKSFLDRELRDISYQDTILSIDIPTSVLPAIYKSSKVLVEPHAILNLAPPDPPVHRGARNKKKKNDKQSSSTTEKKVSVETSQTQLANGCKEATEQTNQQLIDTSNLSKKAKKKLRKKARYFVEASSGGNK